MTTVLEPRPMASDAIANLSRPHAPVDAAKAPRITSIDSLRGLVMFAMIFVNLLAGIPFVPQFFKHYDAKTNGITLADAVYPAFLFIVGMSLPFALGGRLRRGEPVWRTFGHVAIRAASLIFLGVMMVNGRPIDAELGWSARLWEVLMYTSAIAAFCSFGPTRPGAAKPWLISANVVVRALGFVGLIALAFAWRGKEGARLVTLSPFFVNVQWWGILGGIGWSYLTAAIVYLACRDRMPATLACFALLLALYVADANGAFRSFGPSRYVSLGTTIGTHSALTVGGLMIGLLLATPASARTRVVATLWMIVGFAAAAWLTMSPWGVSKIRATPAFSLYCCAITAGVWLLLYWIGDLCRQRWVSAPLAAAGQNVLLAYLLSQMFGSFIVVTGTAWIYYRSASSLPGVMTRASVVAIAILGITWGLNRLSFRLKL